MCRVVQVGGREGAWWLPAGGIRASQGTVSRLIITPERVLPELGLGPEVIKCFSCSTQLSMKFKLLLSN